MIKFLLQKEFVQTVIILAALVLIYFLVKNIIDKILNIRTKALHIDIKKINTLKSLFTNILKYTLIFIGIIVILNAFGVKTTTLLAGLGVVGVVVGLALQDILKDFFSGIFIIIENQFAVGDTVEIDNFKGEVIALGLKTTRIKKFTGEIKIISNRNISSVINYSISNSLALIDINVSYDEDVDKVQKVLVDLCERLNGEIKEKKSKIEYLGVEDLGDSSVTFRISATAKPMEHFTVRREILKEVKKEFDKKKIKIPYPQLEVHNGTEI